jgi:hypothetical protein
MAEYKGIKGFKVQYLSADPSDTNIGQTWYNSTSKDLKFTEFAPASVASGGNLNTTRRGVAGAGTQTAALAFSGYTGTATTAATESYNGTTWTNVTGLPTAVYNTGGTGTQTAALAFGGNLDPGVNSATNLWNGSAWTSGAGPIMAPTGLFEGYGAGTQTATITCGTRVDAPTQPGLNELWDGTSWTSSPGLNTNRADGGTAGNSTSALVYGGEGPDTAYGVLVEEWNGSAWSTQNNKSQGVKYSNNGPVGTVSTALSFGGLTNPGGVASTAIELYDGTSWSTSPVTLPTGKGEAGGAGSRSAALYMGGNGPPSIVNTSFEWTGEGPVTKTITVS